MNRKERQSLMSSGGLDSQACNQRRRWLKTSVVTILILLTYLTYSYFTQSTQELVRVEELKASKVSLKLKHIYHHGTKSEDDIHRRLDITDDFIIANALNSEFQVNDLEMSWSTRYRGKSPWLINLPLKSTSIMLKRLQDRSPDSVEAYLEYARNSGSVATNKISLDWYDDLVDAPNVTDRETVISLALMSSNAYVRTPHTGDWRDVSFNKSVGHGWNGTGLRGHIFTSEDNSTVVIAYKGTSASYLSGSGEDDTVTEDKENDNLLFSCCCARVSYIWTTVCDCYMGSYTCDQRCLEKELYRKDKYYQAAIDVYRNVSNIYPDSNIWVTGHSLGGALASLIGRTFGLPAVSFEAPGDLLATKRLHLPMPPGLPDYMEGIWHFGHTADPIFMGVCNGASSTCSVAGYAMETQCHSGKQCIYDVVTDKGWHVNMLNHRIHTVIDEVLEAYNETAPCFEVSPCRDCFNWNFISDNNNDHKDKSSEEKTTISITTTSSQAIPEPTKERKCVKWSWYGRCIEYEGDGDDGNDKYDNDDKINV